MKQRILLQGLLLLGLSCTVVAQSTDSFMNSMIERINSYYLDQAHDNLYLQTDRSVYFPGDDVFLEVFLSDAATLMPSERSNQFNLLLLDSEGNQVFSTVYEIYNGRYSGQLQLPENLGQGTYRLIGFSMKDNAYTANKVFNKDLFVADPSQAIMLDYDLDKDSYTGGDEAVVSLHVYGHGGKQLKGIGISYTLEESGSVIAEGSVKSDKEGLARISLALPDDPGAWLSVKVKAEKRKISKEMTIELPVERAVKEISFYPEGGAMITAAPGKIAFRAFDDAGRPVNFIGELYGGGEKIADLECYGSGVGSFELVPESGKHYEVRIGEDRFELPEQISNGAALRITGQSGGKLHAGIVRSGGDYPGSKSVLVAILRKGLLYWSAPGTLEQTAKMDIPVKRIPSGVSTLAVFSKEGELLSSRTFFLEPQSSPVIEMTLDKAEYKHRQKVSLDLSLQGRLPASDGDIRLSMAVVPRDLLLGGDAGIYDYLMIESDVLEDAPQIQHRIAGSGEPEVLDALLLALTWNGYSWDYALGIEEEEDISSANDMDGEVAQGIGLSFPEDLNAEKLMDYSIGITDRRHPGIGEPMYKRQLENGMSVLEVIKTIKPYTMSGGKILFQGVSSFYNQQGALIIIDGQQSGDNAAILSTIQPTEVESIHISTNPGEIQKYTGLNVVGVIEITMKGSSINSRLENATPRDEEIRKAMGDYMDGYPDYTNETDAKSVMQDYRTLLYWDSNLELDENRQYHAEFYTSDIKGEFIITVQGMVGLNPVSRSISYEVK